MKKLAILALVLVCGLMSFQADAQKIAYVDMQELVTAMPELASADTALAKYQQDLGQAYQGVQSEFNTKAESFVKDSATMSDAIKEVKRSELRDLQTRMMQLQQSSQQKLQQKQQELIAPIVTKVQQAVEAVAKAKGYTYVINDSGSDSGSGILIVKPAGDNLTAQVKTKLGVK